MLTTNLGNTTIITGLEYNRELEALEAVTAVWWNGTFLHDRAFGRGDPEWMARQHQEQVDYFTWLENVGKIHTEEA